MRVEVYNKLNKVSPPDIRRDGSKPNYRMLVARKVLTYSFENVDSYHEVFVYLSTNK